MSKVNLTKVDGEIAITGISSRLPQCENLEEFKKKLYDGTDMVSNGDARWPDGIFGLHSYGGKLKHLDLFDASYFSISNKHANSTDPQARILLELAYECIVDSGINPTTLRGKKVGVFIAMGSWDAWKIFMTEEHCTSYERIGCGPNMLANKISYAFDFKGPSFSVDAACSGSLVAYQLAVNAIQTGQCDAAIIGGSSIILDPEVSLQFLKLGTYATACRSFDIQGNGFVRSEGISTLFLQKTQEARRIYATIQGVKMNTDGFKEEGLTFPSAKMQSELIKEVYEESGVDMNDVLYVEAHATGTTVGDPQEIEGLANAFFSSNRDKPLLVGTVKSNMGHSESNSGMASLIKVVLAMEEGVIPANLHYSKPKPDQQAILDGKIQVVSKNTPLPIGPVGVTNIGFGGVNSHTILYPNTKEKVTNSNLDIPRLVVVSGRTKEAVEHMLEAAEINQNDSDFLGLIDKIHEEEISKHSYRGFTIIHTEKETRRREIGHLTSARRPLWFVYAGMGSHWAGMGKELMKIETFKQSIQKCSKALEDRIDLERIITTASQEELNQVTNCFCSIIAMEIALTDVLFSIGIKPDGILGHSLGETAAAYADGTVSAEEAVLISYARGKSTKETTLIPGLMASVGLSWKQANERCPPDIFPACDNAPDNVTISGPKKSVEDFVDKLRSEDIFAKIVDTAGRAFHSKYTSDAGPLMLQMLKTISPKSKRRSRKFVSTSSPTALNISAEYHLNNYLSPVLFNDALKHIPANAIVVEIGPTCLLQAILRRALDSNITKIGLVNRHSTDVLESFLGNIGKIYNNGRQTKVSALYKPVSFPVPRGTPMISPLIKWDHSIKYNVPNFLEINQKFGTRVLINMEDKNCKCFLGYIIADEMFFPPTGYITLVWNAFGKLLNKPCETLPVLFRNVNFIHMIGISKNDKLLFKINILKGCGMFEVEFDNKIVCTGNIFESHQTLVPNLENEETKYSLQTLQLFEEDIYKDFSLRGYSYSGSFKGIYTLNDQDMSGFLKWENNWTSFLNSMLQMCVFEKDDDEEILIPKSIEYLTIDPTTFDKFVTKNKKTSVVPVTLSTEDEVVNSLSVQIRKPKFKPHLAQINDGYKKYSFAFVPDITVTENLTNALFLTLQLVQENCDHNLAVYELVHEQSEQLLTPQLYKLTKHDKNCNVHYTLFSKDTNGSLQKATLLAKQWEYVKACSNPAKVTCNLLMTVDVLKTKINIAELAERALKTGGFLLLEEDSHFSNDIENLQASKFVLVTKHTVGTRTIMLFRIIPEIPKNSTVVFATDVSNPFSWLKTLQNALVDVSKQRIYLFAKTTGFIRYFNALKNTPGAENLRLFLTCDKMDQDFTVLHPDCQHRLRMDLKCNVLKNGKWGAYRNISIDNRITHTKVKHTAKNTDNNSEGTVLKLVKDNETVKTHFFPEKSYIILDGLSDFGIALTKWMAKRGANKFIFTTSTAAKTVYQNFNLRHYKNKKLNITVFDGDITLETEMERLLEQAVQLGPIGGIFNTHTKDLVVETFSEKHLERLITSKVSVVRELDELSRKLCPKLDHFVIFSSPTESTNSTFSTSNCELVYGLVESICEARYKEELPAKVIRLPDLNNTSKIYCYVPCIDDFLQTSECINSKQTTISEKSTSSSVCDEKIEDNGTQLQKLVARSLDIENIENIEKHSTLLDLGVDSILLAEIINNIQETFKITISAKKLRSLTFLQLKELGNDSELAII